MGASQPVTKHSVNVLQNGPMKEPSIHDVRNQLDIVISSYTSAEKQGFVVVLTEIYRFMTRCYSDALSVWFPSPQWAWNGSGFVKPSQIVINPGNHCIDLKPYVFTIPDEMLCFKQMFLEQGAFAEDNNKCLISVLQMIKEKHERDASSIDPSHDRREVKLIQEILQELCQREPDEDDIEALLLPTRSNESNLIELTPRKNCVYAKSFGLNIDPSEYFDSESSTQAKLTHRIISQEMADKFELKKFHSHVLDAEELKFEQYGQHEPLTIRLNRLLEDYRDGFAIPKELLQNADDAGAKEIKFLYDERQNKDAQTSLLAPGMRGFQGPALWVYNDAIFTDDDYINLTKLHGATKKEKADKIGKFGLGFNSVYNLTDLPSLVSNESMVLLDPHTSNLGEHISNPSRPGIRLKLTNKRAMKLYKDQWKPYDGVFNLSFNPNNSTDRFDGTLFRFPLRTANQATQSEIKSLAYDNREMKKFMCKLLEGAGRLLLFTQNVSRLSIYHLSDNNNPATDMTRIFSMEKAITVQRPISSQTTSKEGQNILTKAAEMVKTGKKPAKELLYQVVVEVERLLSQSARLFVNDYNSFQSKDTWLITSHIDSGDCFDFAVKSAGLNPSASVAMRLLSESNKLRPVPLECDADKGHIFCHVPLPITTDLPVHLNGSFAVTANRQALQEISEDDKESDMQGPRWNRLLMQGPVAKTYLSTLECVLKTWDGSAEKWFALWPCQTTENNKSCLFSMIKGFYSKLIEGEMRLLPMDGKQWCSWDEMVLFEEELLEDENMKDSIITVFKILMPERNFVDMSKKVKDTISNAGFGKCVEKQSITKQQFFQLFMNNVQNYRLPVMARDTITKYALLHCDDEDLLRNSKCIPTMPQGTLKSPSCLIDYASETKNLFFTKEEVFPAKEFQEDHLRNRLLRLGMVSEDIPMSIFKERAATVKNLAKRSHDDARIRSRMLITLLKKKIRMSTEQIPASQLQTIAFLPVRKEPTDWHPLPWKGEYVDRFLPPSELFVMKYSLLIGCNSAIVDESEETGCGPLGQELSNTLQVRETLTFNDIVAQVEQLSKVNGKLPLPAKEIFFEMYGFFQKRLKDMPEEITKFLKASSTILIDSCVIKPASVSVELSFDARPYLYQLPEEYATNFGALMKKIGVRREFSGEDYLSALHAMKERFKESKLSKEDVKLCRSLLERIRETQEGGSPLDGKIYMPDSNGILRNASEVCINSHPWIPKQDDTKYVHPDIPNALAWSLGAKESRFDHFQKNSIGLPFGQHESLTVRLKKILDSYCVEDQIMNEMLQNADDAKASEVHFILDPRKHGCDKIFCDEWKPLQGPALLIRNNGVFRSEDLTGIQRLGEGSKTDDVFTAGKYGVGFNVVYHLTDAPSLLTSIDGEDVLCLFDPHAKYFEGATREIPGRKIVNAVKNLKETYTDIHSSFLLDTLKDGPGTLFRLPLRSAEMAKSSEISRKEINVITVKEMLKRFQYKLMSSVIFLNHIEKVKISEIDEKTGAINQIYSVTVQCDAASKHQKHLLSRELESVSESMRGNESSLEAFPCKPYTLQITDSMKLCEKWQVIQKVGSIKNIPESVRDHGFDKISCLPVGGIACCESKNGKGFDKIYNVSHHGKYFCLLPLTFKTDLPVNINGQFILEHESRHRLWSTKNESFQRDWNKYLLEDCVAACYAFYIKMRADEIKIHFKKGAINEVIAKTYPGGNVTDPKREPKQGLDNVNKGNINPVRSNAHEALAASDAHQHHERKDHSHNKPPDEMSPRDQTKCFYPRELHSYFTVFPFWSENDEEYTSTLKRRLYQELSDSKALVLPVLRPRHSEIAENVKPEWFAPTTSTDAKFFVPDFTIKETAGKSIPGDVSAFWTKEIRAILDLLLKEGMNIFNIPKYIQDAFERAERSLAKLTPQSVREHLQMKRKLDSVPSKNLKPEKIMTICNVLKFCEIQSLNELDGLPLLVTGDNMLYTFDSLNPVFIDTISEIFTSKKGVCLHYEIKSVLRKAIESFQAKNAEAIDLPVKRFKIEDLLAALNEDDDCKALRITEHVYEIPYSEDTLPSKDWLWKVWSYLGAECTRICDQDAKEQLEMQNDGDGQGKGRDREAEKRKAEERKKELTTQLLQPLSDWCLLPAERKVEGNDAEKLRCPLQRVLVPMKYRNSLCNRDHQIYEILDNIGILRINYTLLRRYRPPEVVLAYTEDPNEKFVREIVASVYDPRAFLYALYMQSLKDRECFEKIYPLQRDKLLEQLNGKDIKWDDGMLEQIRSLKIFNAINGMPFSIEDKEIIIPPDGVPCEGSEIWMRESGVIACKKNASLKQLYQTLGFIQANDLQLYKEYVFPCFAKMTEEDRHKHLVYIKNRDSHKSHDCIKKQEDNKKPDPCPLFEILAEIPFLLVCGTLSRARDLFDHRNPVFHLFLPKSCFPSEKYREEDWMLFLKELGLATKVSSDQYLEFARQVENSSISEKSWEKSRALVSYLFSTKELMEDACFMQSVAHVNYLFADGIPKYLNLVVPAFVEKLSKICFGDSFCVSNSKDVARIWTVAAFLPSYVQCHLSYYGWYSREALKEKQDYLSIKFEISPELVERNFIRVIQSEKLVKRRYTKQACETVLIEANEAIGQRKVTLKDTILEIAEATYEFLSRVKYSIRYLQDHESVLIRDTDYHRLVKPCDATLANDVNLKPYLWTVESYFGRYFDWFKSIGVTDKPSAIQLARVLERIALKLQEKCMDENTARFAHRAVGHLGVALSDQGNIQDIQTLYLPSVSFSNRKFQYLRESHAMIYIDDMSKVARLKKFEQPCLVYKSEPSSAEDQERHLRTLVKKLPERLRPKRLSDLIDEEMIPAERIGNGEVAESLLTTIQSREFRDSLWRLHINEDQSRDDENSKNILTEVLTRIEIRTLNKIETILKYKDEEIPESREDKPCFILKEGDLLVVNITLLPGEDKLLLCTIIARELVSKLHSVISTTKSATLMPLLLSMSPKYMMKSLDALGIRRDKTMDNEHEESFGSHSPTPGDFVPTEIHWLLNNSFEEYDVGEFVAYEVEDPESLESVFIYATVRRKIQEHDDINDNIRNYRYEICIREGEILEVESFQIYKFSRNETGALDTVAGSDDSSSTIDPLIGVTYEEAKTEIIKCLQEAKLLEPDKRRLFIKRLYRKWHPDKHEDRPEFFNKVFQFLMSQIRRMENDEDLLDEEDGGHPSANWNDFFNTWDKEARQNNHHRQQFRSRPGGGSFWRGCPQWRTNSNPQPHEAKRWYRQAKFDFDAANAYRTNKYFEWKCFKCHQVMFYFLFILFR